MVLLARPVVRTSSGYGVVDPWRFKCEIATKLEWMLKTIGEWWRLTGFDGASEVRLMSDLEYQDALSLCISYGEGITLN